LALVAFSVAACGDDDDDTNGDNGGTAGAGATSSDAGEPPMSSGGSDGTGATGGNDGAGATGGAPPTMNVECDEEADGVCQNPNDCPFVESGEARIAAGTCGQTCLTSGNTDEACPKDCLLEEIEISDECGTCYAEAAVCGIMSCAAECIADPEAEECQTCLMESGCREAFNECSGLSE
jgi:hypothetical protein